MICCR